MRSRVSATILLSCVLAPQTDSPIGRPFPSVSRLRFVPCLARSVGLGPVFFPPERGLGHRSVHRLPFPVQSMQIIEFLQGFRPQFLEDSPLHEHLEVSMDCAARTELRRHRLPLTARSQDVKDAVKHRPPTQTRTPTLPRTSELGQERLNPIPHLIWHAKLRRHLPAFRCHIAPPRLNEAGILHDSGWQAKTSFGIGSTTRPTGSRPRSTSAPTAAFHTSGPAPPRPPPTRRSSRPTPTTPPVACKT